MIAHQNCVSQHFFSMLSYNNFFYFEKSTSPRIYNMFEVIAIFAVFATVFPIGKMALLYTQPIFLTSIRMICAGILLIAYHWWSSYDRTKITPQLIYTLLLLSLFNIYLTNVCEFWGLQYLSAAKACFIYNLSPFASAFFLILFIWGNHDSQKVAWSCDRIFRFLSDIVER